jgi:dCTP deaminase
MAILVDWQLANRCRNGLVTPFDQELVNPASVDLRLGDTLLIESVEGPELKTYPLSQHSQEDPYLLRPGQFVLACTMETVHLTADVGAQFLLKSSRAREGLNHLMAGWIDPGFRGALTLELHNVRQLQAQPLWPGLRIGQLIVHYLASQPGKSYAETGRYLGDTTAQESKG